MIGAVIRKFSSIAYRHPRVPQDVTVAAPFGKLKIALLADYYTSISLAQECRIRSLKPDNLREVLINWKPDLIFVESAFHGVEEEWRYKLGKQPVYLRFFPSREIRKITNIAADRNIPAMFWNKDDKAFYQIFIDVAKNFKFVFTTDSDCLEGYRKELGSQSHVELLAMPYQPLFHNFTGFAFEKNDACFVGSYYRKILKCRRTFLDMLFHACLLSNIRLNIYDRNSSRASHFFEFRYPLNKLMVIHKGVPYSETADLYKKYSISINVNSISDSPTMVSRRLLEILACGGICVTNSNPAVQREFKDFCHVATSAEDALETLTKLREGPKGKDLEMAAAGAEHVSRRHTWICRLEQLADTINF